MGCKNVVSVFGWVGGNKKQIVKPSMTATPSKFSELEEETPTTNNEEESQGYTGI